MKNPSLGLIPALMLATGVLAEEPLELDELLISASTVPVSSVAVGSSVTVITAEQLQARGVQYLADALRQVPGLAVNRGGGFGGLTQVRVRGAEGNHVLVLIDGVEVAPADTGELDLSTLSVSDVQRIEVLRGPQSGLYGSNALAGVIAITTRRAAAGLQGRLHVESGAFESHQAGLSISGGRPDLNGAVSLSRRQETGLNNARAGNEEDDNRLDSLAARGSWSLDATSELSVAVRWVEKDSETDPLDFSGGPAQGQIVDGADTSDTRDLNLALALELGSGSWRHRGEVSRVETRLDGEGGFGGFGSDTARSRVGWQSTRLLDAQANRYLTAFVELEQESFQNRYPSDPSQQGKLERDLAGVGLEYRTRIGQSLHLAASLRQDFNDEFEDATTGRLTVARLFNGDRSRLHASLGRGVTNPTFFEQFGFTPGFFVGNPDLQPETSVAWDLGLEHRWDSAMADVTVFDADLDDEIIASFPTVVNAAGQSSRRGVEVTFQAHWSERWDLQASYTWTDSKQPDGSEELRVPEHLAALDLGYALAGGRSRLHLGVTHNGSMLDADFRRFFSNGFVADFSRLDSYTQVNVGLQHELSPQLSVYIDVKNLLDEDYEELVSYNAPGRGAYFGLRYQFGR